MNQSNSSKIVNTTCNTVLFCYSADSAAVCNATICVRVLETNHMSAMYADMYGDQGLLLGFLLIVIYRHPRATFATLEWPNPHTLAEICSYLDCASLTVSIRICNRTVELLH